MSLRDQQKRLSISVINYDLERMWGSHTIIADLRKRMSVLMPKDAFYDPQDLEHQVLFRLTTFDPKEITDELIKTVVNEQYKIVRNRLDNTKYDLKYLFRGLSGEHSDLSVKKRLSLCWEDGCLVAKDKDKTFNVEFKIVHDEEIISLFSSDLHYIHRDRPKGDTFGFYFSGDTIPWAIETTEPSVIAKQYKRDALLSQGIDPNKAVELTRFYSLPGSPVNAISLMDGLVGKYYKKKGIEALYTTTMPMYSKTKSATIAGGINKPLLVKDLRHKFMPVVIGGKTYYRHITTISEQQNDGKIIKTHPNFPTMLVVEVFRALNTLTLDLLPVLKDGSKVIYIAHRENINEEEEIKLKIDDVGQILERLRDVAKHINTEYIRDIIYGTKDDEEKIRLRIKDNFLYQKVNATHKYKVSLQENVKKEIEETIYRGNSVKDATNSILLRGDYKEENSYEKIRILFNDGEGVKATIDVYPFGAWLEIEAEKEKIHLFAKKMGFSKKDYINLSADDLYLSWIKKHNLPEKWDIRFGLYGKK